MSEREDDLEQQTIELHFQQAMHQTKKKAVLLTPNGECYNCDESIDHDQLFCDVDCRDDYEKRKRAESQRIY